MTVEQRTGPAFVEVGAMPNEPIAWVGTAQDYNGDRIHGDWVQLARPMDEVTASVAAVVDRTPNGLGQRWAVHELRNFGPWRPSESQGLGAIVRVALGIRFFGMPYAGLVSAIGVDDIGARYDRFKQSYLGSWPSMRHFAHEMAVDCGWYGALQTLPRPMHDFVQLDLDQMAVSARRDLTVVGHDDGVWVYDPRRW